VFRLHYWPQLACCVAGTRVIPPFKLNVPSLPLQEAHIGTIQIPEAPGFVTWAPSSGEAEQLLTEQELGHDLPEFLTQ
jgi:hypothetical protein